MRIFACNAARMFAQAAGFVLDLLCHSHLIRQGVMALSRSEWLANGCVILSQQGAQHGTGAIVLALQLVQAVQLR